MLLYCDVNAFVFIAYVQGVRKKWRLQVLLRPRWHDPSSSGETIFSDHGRSHQRRERESVGRDDHDNQPAATGCDFFEWVDTEIFHPNCGVGCCIHGGLSGQALMSGCCSWQPQRSPPYNYGDHHGGCPSTIFRSPCSSHHKDDSFGDKMKPPQ
uniref:Uncharacterized protein n=1 Tax=Cannabis sativa TaxID=3483 RepID=A0A803Q943_CANSA